MGWLFLLYWRWNLVLPSFTSKTFLIYSPNLVMDSVCCLCLGCPSNKPSSFISVFIKDSLIILYNSHLPLASSCMTDLSLWPFFLCILQTNLPICMWMFGVGNWNWPEKKPLGEVVWVSLVSLVSLWKGLVWRIAAFIYRSVWLVLGLILKEFI